VFPCPVDVDKDCETTDCVCKGVSFTECQVNGSVVSRSGCAEGHTGAISCCAFAFALSSHVFVNILLTGIVCGYCLPGFVLDASQLCIPCDLSDPNQQMYSWLMAASLCTAVAAILLSVVTVWESSVVAMVKEEAVEGTEKTDETSFLITALIPYAQRIAGLDAGA